VSTHIKVEDRQNTNSDGIASVTDNRLWTGLYNANGVPISINTTGEIKEVNSDNILANQTNGSHKTMLVNSAGNIADVTSTGSQYVSLQKEDGNNLCVDDSTSSLCVEDYSHNRIHEGKHFFDCNFIDIANNSQYELIIITPNTAEHANIVWFFQFEGEGELEIKEGVTFDATGTEITPINNNRNSSTINSTLLYHTPTNATGGSYICHQRVGSGRTAGGDRRSDEEVILKQNTNYLIRAINRIAGSPNLFNWKLEWYEHTRIV
jgi:hypothetical protein